MTHPNTQRPLWLLPGLVASACIAAIVSIANAQAPPKKAVNSQTDLPRHAYVMAEPASSFVTRDDAAFKPFAMQVLADVNATLDGYDIHDRATLRQELQAKLAAQDLLGDNQGALATLKALRDEQDKPDLRLTTGLAEQAVLRARILTGASSGPAYESEVARTYAQLVNALPWSTVGDALREQESGLELQTAPLTIARLKRDVDPAVSQAGSVSDESAQAILSARRAIRVILPVKERLIADLRDYIKAHNVEPPDIWPAREVTLSAQQKLTPVRIGIWDSGVDTALYPTQLYLDPDPGAHSPHGLAFDLQGALSKPDLEPLTSEQRQAYPHMLTLFQGLDDLNHQIDTPAASEVRRWASSTPPDQLPSMLKMLSFFGNYAHGTHVAGIAVRGNPAARLVVARFNDELPDLSFAPTLAWTSRFAADFKEIGEYFNAHHVRVVNMSWSDDVEEFETWLSKTAPVKDPAQRKAQAMELYREWRSGIEQAIRSAPDTLFVAAAGNSDSNAGFAGGVPASLHLPNLITVGAVNQGGEATTFTSYGDTVLVYAAGYRVDSFVPGGRRMRFSGTSMASPNVVNLAAKLFALRPSLTPSEAIALIRRGADTSADGRLHVINPKKTVALLSTLP